MSVTWNPWHGCHKISPGCKNCYVYRKDSVFDRNSAIVTKNSTFNLPIKKNRKKEFKISKGELVNTCFTSDFFLEEADSWRIDAWKMIKERTDLKFFIITKRPDRFYFSLPEDWKDGYDNVEIACTVENQEMADLRLPIFLKLPIKHKAIAVSPILENIDLTPFLNEDIEIVVLGGESGKFSRICSFDWVLNIRNQCINANVPFLFHQTGSKLLKDNKVYNIPRKFHHLQAKKANINFKIEEYYENKQ